ncbi:TolC family protein [Xylophilus sp. GW821-FHT01B05]
MPHFPGRLCAARTAGLLLAALCATATAQPLPTLREALEQAWALGAPARSQPGRSAELDARARGATSPIAGPPVLGLSQRNDQLQRRGGLSETETEIAVPLWTPGLRDATQRQVGADRTAFEQELARARLQLAGTLREAAAQAAVARIEREAALRRQLEAATLADDVARRVRAGESARVEALQAQALRQQAGAALTQAEQALADATAHWRALTGLATVASPEESAHPATSDDLAAHPALQAAEARQAAAQARLRLVDADRRDPVEVGVGLTHDRGAYGERGQYSARLLLRIPLATEQRNRPRQAAALAEAAAADAERDAVAREITATVTAARSGLAASQRGIEAAAERARLSDEAQALIRRGYQLGESSLLERLRADNEKYEADLALARARLDGQRAQSRLLQALGQLP